jgi:hypothetical protein
LDKGEKEKLEEIIRLLRRLLSRDDYKPRLEYRASRHNLPIARGGGGYRPRNYFSQHYQAYQGSRLRGEAKSYEAKEKAGSYSAKTWNEPMQYQPRERIVYDPEVKRILKSIEQKLSLEPNAEEILRQLENNPELYEKLVERLGNDLESSEANEPDLDQGAEEEAKYEASEQGLEEAEESIDQESSKEAKPSIDEVLQKDAEVEAKIEEESLESSSEAEISTEPFREAKPSEEIEPQVEELSNGVIEEIEAQDLSSLEAELYQEPLEPLEIEPELEPAEPSVQRNEPLEQRTESEAEEC